MTDKQIRDRIVGVLSVSMMPMELETQCVAFLDRSLEAAEAIRGMAKAMSGCRDVCEVCANRRELPLNDCEDADCGCSICKANCACAGCEDGSNFVWRGFRDRSGM